MKITLVQLSPGSNKRMNIFATKKLIERAVLNERPDLIVLPEIWTCLGGTFEQKWSAAESINNVDLSENSGSAVQALRQLARTHRIFIHGGSIGELDGDRLLNTSIVISPDGTILDKYSKIHLFDIITPNGHTYKESDTYRGGHKITTVLLNGDFGQVRLGLAICYDLRFPELFRELRKQGADVIALPAAFTVETGMAHWEPLIRARAIETQCWIVAAGTVGAHKNDKGELRTTYGHSMIVDPWGMIVAETSSSEEDLVTATIDCAMTMAIRARMPILDHQRF